jgi:signal transduction histidine kinase/CheY-like chemotaxis protein
MSADQTGRSSNSNSDSEQQHLQSLAGLFDGISHGLHTPLALILEPAQRLIDDEGSMDLAQRRTAAQLIASNARVLLRNVNELLDISRQAREQSTQSLAREHEAREEAELQKRLLHSLFMQAPTLIAVVRGPDHIIELANPPMRQVVGRSEQDILNRPLFEVMPELRDQIFPALLDEVFHSGVPYTGKEIPARVDLGNGTRETIYFNFVYSPFRNIEGEIEGIFIIASDVTAQVAAREQINGLRVAAEGANRAKDEFLAMLGHELRNPLSPIVTALQIMKLQGPAGSERARTVIERQVNHLIRLVDDLLDVSRIARGKVALKKEPLELADIVSKAVEMVSPLLEQRAHTLIVDVPRSGLLLNGDPTRLSQVVSNLLTNAAKYTPAAGRITLHAQASDGEVVLRVRDTGIGIAPEVLPRIFDLFVQERQAIDRSQGGLGLGLAIVRNLIECHGGTVAVRSEGVGRGSEFIVRLPASQTPASFAAPLQRSAAATVSPLARTQRPRILVVDDNEDGVAMLAHMLVTRGYETRVAHDGPSALQLAAQFRPQVALLDIGLPVMDGYELAAHLRSIPELDGLQLIALTGYGQESDHERSRAAGFHHHLVKPVGADVLEAVIQLPAPTR